MFDSRWCGGSEHHHLMDVGKINNAGDSVSASKCVVKAMFSCISVVRVSPPATLTEDQIHGDGAVDKIVTSLSFAFHRQHTRQGHQRGRNFLFRLSIPFFFLLRCLFLHCLSLPLLSITLSSFHVSFFTSRAPQLFCSVACNERKN